MTGQTVTFEITPDVKQAGDNRSAPLRTSLWQSVTLKSW
jgi:hypothetical protein